MRSAARLDSGSKGQLSAVSCQLSAFSFQLSVPQLSGSGLSRVDLDRLRKNPCSPQDWEGHDVQSCHKSRNIKVGFTVCRKTVILGGAAFQRCDKAFSSVQALAAEVLGSCFSANCLAAAVRSRLKIELSRSLSSAIPFRSSGSCSGRFLNRHIAQKFCRGFR
jgi:hypothetical protein